MESRKLPSLYYTPGQKTRWLAWTAKCSREYQSYIDSQSLPEAKGEYLDGQRLPEANRFSPLKHNIKINRARYVVHKVVAALQEVSQ